MAVVDCPHCGYAMADDDPICVYCHRSPPACRGALRVEGVDGAIPLVDRQPVVVGRMSTHDLLGGALNRHDDVGRQHAEVTLRCDRVEVRDNHSKFGTFVDDERLEPGTARLLVLPADVRLARACTIHLDRA